MALTKVGKEGITGISNASDATFLTATSAEGVTLAGTLAVTGVHTVGTNAVATSDGGAVTTSVVQGLSKAWVNFNGTGTIAIRGSQNVSSLTDNGTGDYTVNFTNAFGAADYGFSGLTSGDAVQAAFVIEDNSGANRSNAATTSFTMVVVNNAGNIPVDRASVNGIAHGDLA